MDVGSAKDVNHDIRGSNMRVRREYKWERKVIAWVYKVVLP